MKIKTKLSIKTKMKNNLILHTKISKIQIVQIVYMLRHFLGSFIQIKRRLKVLVILEKSKRIFKVNIACEIFKRKLKR